MVVLNEYAITPEQELLCAQVEAARLGDGAAFGALVERFERAVYATALRRLRSESDAQELVQEVFIQALRKIGQLREPERFAGWLRSITVRMAINRSVRQRRAFSAEPETLEANCVERETPLAQLLARERQSQVRAGLRKLKRLDRETLVAFYVNGQSLVEMSDRFDAPVGTIKRRLHVARKRLAEQLEHLLPA
ncbi:MAG: sigma-70 family RNA polymerase sigma factor [Pirellulales bacterium]|nr:sigma-70 family RNA polymerase sigma factor [Pirellulales bacterium]